MTSFEAVNTYTSYIAIVTVVFAFLELGYDLKRKRARDLKEAFANSLVILITRTIASVSTAVLLYETLRYVETYALFQLQMGPVLEYLAIFLVADFCYYLSHYFSHKFRLLWAIHGVHHSSKEFNLFTAFRLNWISPVVDMLFYTWPVFLFGLDVVIFSAMRILILVMQFWIHTDKLRPVPWFDVLFNSPANHQIHHSIDIAHRDKNFGGVFMWWDHLFGTYRQPDPLRRPKNFGVCVPVNSYNPFKIYFHEFFVWYREIRPDRNRLPG